MTLLNNDQELKTQIEKLIDWELNKQLTWAVVFLTTILGLLGIITVNFTKAPFIIIFSVLLLSGADFSFYRIIGSHVTLRNYHERFEPLQNARVYYDELVRARRGDWFFRIINGIFLIERENHFHMNRYTISLAVILMDLLFAWSLISIV
jgi:hypothetical protein